MFDYNMLNKKQKENVSFEEFYLFVNYLFGIRDVGYKTAAFEDSIFQYWFDLEREEATKWRRMENKYDIDSTSATNWQLPYEWTGKRKNIDLTSEAIYNIIWFDKNNATHGFTMF